jgi:DNA repair exonuclease SbcCD ATPase subunit
MKNTGITILVITLGASIYLVLFTQIEQSRVLLFIAVWVFIGVIFLVAERIIKVEIPFLKIQAKLEKAKSDVEEIEKILGAIQSHKDLIELIVRDGNTAQKQMREIETVAKDARVKAEEIESVIRNINSRAQQIEKLAKDANEKAKQTDKDFKKYKKDWEDALRNATRGRRF